MAISTRCDFATLGAYTKDTIVSKAGTRYVDGGGYSYAAHAARLAGLEVAAITRLAAEDRGSTRLLTEAGVQVVIRESRASTLMRLEYPTDNVDERVLTVAAVADAFEPADIGGVDARAWLVSASVRGEVSLEVLQALKAKGGLIGLDVQGYVRVVGADGRLHYAPWPEQRAVLALVDVLKTDAVEAEFLTGTADIHRAAAMLAAQGPREIVLTHRDGVLVLAEGSEYAASFHPEPLRGRSGRGDTCVGSYLARRLTGSPGEATIWAAAVTSLKMEAEGPIRRPVADVHAMIARKYAAT
ncbi:MAG: PfkB family carbohydrate kinase [Steroidobacteraceae bacterium]